MRLQQKVKPEASIIYPLNEFYEQLGLSVPEAVRVEGRDIPEPYRSLLVHNRDMTPTLEQAHDQPIHLRVLEHAVAGDVMSRRVLLAAENRAEPVLFGASKIHLRHFQDEARRLVLARDLPLGTILRAQAMEHSGHPDGFFRVIPDDLIHSALGLRETTQLYGRRNSLVDRGGQTLAQVVEILAPRNGNSHTERNLA